MNQKEVPESPAIVFLSLDSRIRSWSAGAGRLYGYAATEAVGQSISMLNAGQEEISVSDTGYARVIEQRRRDGVVIAVEISTSLLEGEFSGYCLVARAFQPKGSEEDTQFRLLVQGVTDYAVFMLSPSGNVVTWNPGAERIKGYKERDIVGKHFSRFYTEEDLARDIPGQALSIALKEGRFEAEGWRVRQDGSRFWASVVIDPIRDASGNLSGFAKVTRDISERQAARLALEEARNALVQAQKIEAIGKLTGGVAHDFNNVLQILRGNLELLIPRLTGDAPASRRLETAIEAVDRGAKLASQLLAFGRRQPLRPEVVNLGRLLRNIGDLLRGALNETVRMETVVAGGLWNTCVDVYQLENVILNLAINARDAMPDGGKLTLELSNAMLDDLYAASQVEVRPGQYVLLAVTDTGAGMSKEIAEKAFEPFFTTKPEGMGTGLGLSSAHGFVKQSGGHIKIYSEVGHGTTIKVYLPRSMEEEAEPRTVGDSNIVGGTETILVVEDDPQVQATAVELLSELGYRVLKAEDAESALSILRSGLPIDLLFTDVVMPGKLRSPELARKAQRLLPKLQVLFTSGYTQNAIVHGGRLDAGVDLIVKPYGRTDLASKVRQILNRKIVAGEARPSSGVVARKRILVVEDLQGSLEVTCELLETLGHTCSGVRTAEEALACLADRRFDVLFTDVWLPGMSGLELAHQSRLRWPHLRIVVSSGEEISRDKVPADAVSVLRKPVAIETLRAVIDA